MKNQTTFSRFSSKYRFHLLRDKFPIFCPTLKREIHITRKFFNHIFQASDKARNYKEIQARLACLDFIVEIITKGKIVEIREKTRSIQIQHIIDEYIFHLVAQVQNKKIQVVSCFITTQKKLVLTCVGTSSLTEVLPDPSFSRLCSDNTLKNNDCQLPIKKVHNFLEQEDLVGKKLGIFVSGGVDSMVLLDVLSQEISAENLYVLHVNHGTREICDEEEDMIRKICAQKNIKVFVKNLNITPESPLKLRGEKNSKPPQKNREKYWRDLRKAFEKEVTKREGLDRVLTAHHATDLAETMIFRLTKGAGVSGMTPFDISTKPLWDISKSEILDYALIHNLWWSEDTSNQDTEKFQRNLIRHEVLPALKKITPNLEKVMVKNFYNFKNMEDFLGEEVKKMKSLINDPLSPAIFETSTDDSFWQTRGSVNLKKFLGFTEILQQEFLRSICIASGKTPSFSEMQDFFRWLRYNPPGNSEKFLGEVRFMIQKKHLKWNT